MRGVTRGNFQGFRNLRETEKDVFMGEGTTVSVMF